MMLQDGAKDRGAIGPELWAKMGEWVMVKGIGEDRG